ESFTICMASSLFRAFYQQDRRRGTRTCCSWFAERGAVKIEPRRLSRVKLRRCVHARQGRASYDILSHVLRNPHRPMHRRDEGKVHARCTLPLAPHHAGPTGAEVSKRQLIENAPAGDEACHKGGRGSGSWSGPLVACSWPLAWMSGRPKRTWDSVWGLARE